MNRVRISFKRTVVRYAETSLFSLSDFEELSGVVSEVILSLSFTDSGILTK
jgi:hypothetical protein